MSIITLKLKSESPLLMQADTFVDPLNPLTIGAHSQIPICKTVVVQRARLMRYRPIFNQWSCEFTISYDEEILNRDEVLSIAESAGKFSGIGTWRPRFGRFSIEVVEG